MSAVAVHQPSTPLPWIAAEKSPDFNPIRSGANPAPLIGMLSYTTDDDGIHFDPKDVAYIAHTGTAYPALVEAILNLIDAPQTDQAKRLQRKEEARLLLVDLGEWRS